MSESHRKWVFVLVFAVMILGITLSIYKAARTPIQAYSLPKEVFHIPVKCRKQAFDITQGQMQAELPMMQAREMEDLANRCGGWVEKDK